MKILLLSPENTLVCFGLRQVSAALKLDGHDVRALFMPREFNDEEPVSELNRIGAFIQQIQPELIGISLMSSHMNRVKRLMTLIRNVSRAPVLWGGVHPTLAPEECIVYADYVCVGEGEFASRELAAALSNGGDATGIPGIWAKSAGAFIRNPARSRHPNLDELPYADFDMTTHWLVRHGEIAPMTEALMRHYIPALMDTHYVLSSRGCPHNCTYCCNSALRNAATGPYLRRRSVSHFIGEMVELRNRFEHLKGFVIMDDSFLYGDRKWFEEFADSYARQIGLPFLCWANPTAIREDLLQLLIKAGCIGIHVGLQSGSPRISEGIYNRGVPVSTFTNAMRLLAKHKRDIVDRRVDVITDNPYENEEDVAATIELLSRLEKPFWVGIVSLMFYPATELTKRAAEDNMLADGGAHIYFREFFHYQPTYLNRVMRTVPVTPGRVIRRFVRRRHSSWERLEFYLYYFGYFIPIRRTAKRLRRRLMLWLLKTFEHKFTAKQIVRIRVSLIDF